MCLGNGRSKIKISGFVYLFATAFMIFFSVNAIHSWPNLWAQAAISLACICPALILLYEKPTYFFRANRWSIENKVILVIVLLGALNICFSENQPATFKGMVLFLISGILVFSVSCVLFESRNLKSNYIFLCSISFVIVVVFGFVEVISGESILFLTSAEAILFSHNPIPAGSLIILLSVGPLFSLTQNEVAWKKWFWIFSLAMGILLVILIGKRSPVLAIALMLLFFIVLTKKHLYVLILITMVLAGIGHQFKDSFFVERYLNKETLLVRMEFYHVALDVLKEKPLFGIGFNSSLSRFVPFYYEPKVFPLNSDNSFQALVGGVFTFDNMFLCLLGEGGGLFTLAYICLGVILFKKFLNLGLLNMDSRLQVTLLLAVLVGFGVHSLAYDSLKYPHLNWLFHSLLAFVVHCRVLPYKSKE